MLTLDPLSVAALMTDNADGIQDRKFDRNLGSVFLFIFWFILARTIKIPQRQRITTLPSLCAAIRRDRSDVTQRSSREQR
jgi:hypothetical protein